MHRHTLLVALLPLCSAVRVAVFGGSGFIGSYACRALVASGCEVTSISRAGQNTLGPTSLVGKSQTLLEKFDGEAWLEQVTWVSADATMPDCNSDGKIAAALAGADAVVGCMGSGDDLLTPSTRGWMSGYTWSEMSEVQYAANYAPNAKAVAAAKAAGAKRFVLVGVSSVAQMGFGGTLPGLYTGKRDAALAAHAAFGDGFTFIGPHLVVESSDARLKLLDSGLARGLTAFNKGIGGISSAGEDYSRTTSLTPPVSAGDLAIAIAAVATGRCEVEYSERFAGMTVASGVADADKVEICDRWRHVDGTAAIRELAAAASR